MSNSTFELVNYTVKNRFIFIFFWLQSSKAASTLIITIVFGRSTTKSDKHMLTNEAKIIHQHHVSNKAQLSILKFKIQRVKIQHFYINTPITLHPIIKHLNTSKM